MEYRVVWLSGIVVGTAAVASSSCYAPDPGEVTFSERPRTESGPTWGFAGTVYETINGGATVKNAEVRVSDAQGKLFASVYTDDNGNFWYEGAKPPANSRVGVRNAAKKEVMVGVVAGDTGGACNAAACHGGAAMRIYLK